MLCGNELEDFVSVRFGIDGRFFVNEKVDYSPLQYGKMILLCNPIELFCRVLRDNFTCKGFTYHKAKFFKFQIFFYCSFLSSSAE